MVRKAALIGMLAALPSGAIAQDSPCGGPRELTICEAELYDVGVTWEGRARESRALLFGCLEKLRVRTSTVINKLVIPPNPPQAPSLTDEITVYITVGAAGLGAGLLLGLLLR